MDSAVKRPLVRELYETPMKPEQIEQRSFDIIDEEAGEHGFSTDEWIVARRMIHTTANFDLLADICFSPDAISSAVDAMLRGAPIYVDSNMIRGGISIERLRKANDGYTPESVLCHVADKDVAEQAKAAGLPRSLFAVRKAKAALHGGIAVFGNAPVALMELNRMIMEDGVCPAAVIAMPVGFVHVVESKEELMSLDTPYIALAGRRGGSPLAVSVIHSLSIIAAGRKEKSDAKS